MKRISDKIATVCLYGLLVFSVIIALSTLIPIDRPIETHQAVNQVEYESYENKYITMVNNWVTNEFDNFLNDIVQPTFTMICVNDNNYQEIYSAIKLIGTDPQKAEKSLKKYSFDFDLRAYQFFCFLFLKYRYPKGYMCSTQREDKFVAYPLAKMYLAYIYMTDKVKVKDKKQLINKLMLEAINQCMVIVGFFEGSYGREGGYAREFNSVGDLFYTMKFVEHDVPMWILREQPELTLDVLTSPYHYSNADNFIARLDEDDTFIDISHFKHVQKVLDYTSDKYAIPEEAAGSMRYGYYIKVKNIQIKAVYLPKSFIDTTNFDFGFGREDNIYNWQEAWDKLSKDKQFMVLYLNAHNELKRYYRKHFKLSILQTNIAAKNALFSMLVYHYYNPFGMFKEKTNRLVNL